MAITMKQFCKNQKLEIKYSHRSKNPNMPDFQGNHFLITLFNRETSDWMNLYFSMGSGIKESPKVEDIVNCLWLDSDCDNYSFEEWCDNLGYDPDSRKAKKIYDLCNKQTKEFKELIGLDAFEKLYDVEPL